MKMVYAALASLLVMGSLASCEKEKKQTLNNIIVPPREVSVPDTIIHQMNETESHDEVSWVGSVYKVKTHRYSNDSLSVVTDETGKRYRNNVILVKITRKDGSTFFEKKFTKALFDGLVDDDYLKKNLLLGLVYNGTDKDGLHFLGSVGSPDILTEEYVPFIVTINKNGEVSVEKGNLDTREGVDSDETNKPVPEKSDEVV